MSYSILEQKVVEIIDGIQRLAEPAMQVTLGALRAGAIIDLFTAAILFASATTVALKVLPGFWKSLQESNYNDELSQAARFWASCIVTTTVGLVSACTLLSTHLWLSVISPEFALARALVSKVIG